MLHIHQSRLIKHESHKTKQYVNAELARFQIVRMYLRSNCTKVFSVQNYVSIQLCISCSQLCISQLHMQLAMHINYNNLPTVYPSVKIDQNMKVITKQRINTYIHSQMLNSQKLQNSIFAQNYVAICINQQLSYIGMYNLLTVYSSVKIDQT